MKGVRGVTRTIFVAAMLLSALALPAAAQDAPADSATPLTMEEAERVVYGLRDALNGNDLDTAMSFFAEDVTYLSHSESDAGTPDHTLYPVRKGYETFLHWGCHPFTAITGIEGNTVSAVEYWTCIPQQYAFFNTLVAVEATIVDGKIVAFDELIFDANKERWAEEEQLQRAYEAFHTAVRRGELDRLDTMLADDVELSLSYDPVSGQPQELAGKEAVLALFESWRTAQVKYSGIGWAESGPAIMAYGRLKWPEWTEVMGVELRSDDEVVFKDGKVTLISIGTSPEMMRVYMQRKAAAE